MKEAKKEKRRASFSLNEKEKIWSKALNKVVDLLNFDWLEFEAEFQPTLLIFVAVLRH